MFRVDDVYDEAKKIIGVCDDTKLFRWLGDAVSLIANKADFEGWKGFLDICTEGCACERGTSATCNVPTGCGRQMISLPREVDVVLGVNIGGQPSLGQHQLFEFHLNGMGSCKTICDWSWMDQGGGHPTTRDLVTPAQLVAHLDTAADNNAELVVYGFDSTGRELRHQEAGEWEKGYRVPTIYGVALPTADAPTVGRITGVYKSVTVGEVTLSTIDADGSNGVNLGVYAPDETTPQYRRIRINRCANWVRVAYMKTNPVFRSKSDHVPLRSRIAFLLAVQARKHYSDLNYDEAHSCEADAVRMEIEAQQRAEPPVYMPVQILDMNNPRDKNDFDIR